MKATRLLAGCIYVLFELDNLEFTAAWQKECPGNTLTPHLHSCFLCLNLWHCFVLSIDDRMFNDARATRHLLVQLSTNQYRGGKAKLASRSINPFPDLLSQRSYSWFILHTDCYHMSAQWHARINLFSVSTASTCGRKGALNENPSNDPWAAPLGGWGLNPPLFRTGGQRGKLARKWFVPALKSRVAAHAINTSMIKLASRPLHQTRQIDSNCQWNA